MTDGVARLRYVMLWCAAMTWHLYRIATLRPAYRHLGDTLSSLISFSLVYCLSFFVLERVRNEVLYPGSAPNVIMELLLLAMGYAVRYMLFRGSGSRAGLMAALGAATVANLLSALALASGLATATSAMMSVGLELVLCTAALYQFHRLPPEIRVTNYRAKSHRARGT